MLSPRTIGVFWSTHGVAASWARNWASPPLSWHSCWPKKEDVVVEVAEKVINVNKSWAKNDVRIEKRTCKTEHEYGMQQLQWEVFSSSHDFWDNCGIGVKKHLFGKGSVLSNVLMQNSNAPR